MKTQSRPDVTTNPIAFRLFLSMTALMAVLWMGGTNMPAAWALAALGAVMVYRFSEMLLALFIIFFPPGLYIAGIVSYWMR